MTLVEQNHLIQERERSIWLDSRPVCDWCREPIQDDYLYHVGGDMLCQSCFDDYVEHIREEIE